MQAFVVAVEYLGADVDECRDDIRTAICEHAYDLVSAALAAHDGHPPRYAFPTHQRGWSTTSTTPRCGDCAAAVDAIVDAIITAHLTALHPRTAGQTYTTQLIPKDAMTDPADTDPPETDAVRSGADIERTADADQTHHPREAEKQKLEALLTTDPAAQNTDTVIDPTSS